MALRLPEPSWALCVGGTDWSSLLPETIRLHLAASQNGVQGPPFQKENLENTSAKN